MVYASYTQPNGLLYVGLIRYSVGNTIQRVGKVSRNDRRYGGTIERSELNRKRRIKKVGRVRKFKRSRKYEESGEVEGRKMMSQVTRTGGKSEGRGGTGCRDGELPRGN